MQPTEIFMLTIIAFLGVIVLYLFVVILLRKSKPEITKSGIIKANKPRKRKSTVKFPHKIQIVEDLFEFNAKGEVFTFVKELNPGLALYMHGNTAQYYITKDELFLEVSLNRINILEE